MGINWKVRLRNKWFWLTAIPAALLLVQQVAAVFGLALDLGQLQEQLAGIVGTLFGLLALLGVTVDMTTAGVSDSARALSYEEPSGAPAHARGE